MISHSPPGYETFDQVRARHKRLVELLADRKFKQLPYQHDNNMAAFDEDRVFSSNDTCAKFIRVISDVVF